MKLAKITKLEAKECTKMLDKKNKNKTGHDKDLKWRDSRKFRTKKQDCPSKNGSLGYNEVLQTVSTPVF